jgi:hypothetical protein
MRSWIGASLLNKGVAVPAAAGADIKAIEAKTISFRIAPP